MNSLKELERHILEIEQKIDYVFKDKSLLLNAFVHRSFLNEHRATVHAHNERLEFLGDSVLGLIISEHLYHLLPTHPEGQLSQLRSKIVDAVSCAYYLQKLALADYILLGRGEKLGEGKSKTSILADAFEAIIGSIYVDGGETAARSFILGHFSEEITQVIGSPPRNCKADLQDYSQKKYQKPPRYEVVQETGPEHGKMFHVKVWINDQEMGLGIGNSKKEAEQKAAAEALAALQL